MIFIIFLFHSKMKQKIKSKYVTDCESGVITTKIKTLEEDDDQGEMDTVFFLFLLTYTIYLSSIDLLYNNQQDKQSIGKLNLIMSNLWAFFPIMQAQGLWLKFLLMITCYYSITWHWTEIGMTLPGETSYYGILDATFSMITIISYCLSWIPKFKSNLLSFKCIKSNFFRKNCIGNPKETGEWRCRITKNLILNIFICTCFGIILYKTRGAEGTYIQIVCSWTSIAIAIISALYQLLKGEMKVGKKYRKKFALWAFFGIMFGSIAFIYKMKSNNEDENSLFNHSIWHTYVMSCAYSFSRASEYLEIY